MTGEAVPLEMRLAKFPSRALAITIDFIVLFVVALVFVMIIGALAPGLDQALGAALTLTFGVALLVGVASGAYSSIFIAAPTLLWLEQRAAKREAARAAQAQQRPKSGSGKSKRAKARA